MEEGYTIKRDPGTLCPVHGIPALFITEKLTEGGRTTFAYQCDYCGTTKAAIAIASDELTEDEARELARDKFLHPEKYKKTRRRKKADDDEGDDE